MAPPPSLAVLKYLSRQPFEIACPEVYIRVHFFPTYIRVCREKTSFVCAQNSLLISTLSLHGRIDGEFLRSKNVAVAWNHGHPRPRMYIRVHSWATSSQANSLLLITTDIPVRSETTKNTRRRTFCTLRIFSSGTDAAGYIRSDVSAVLKLAAKSVQGCTLLAMQRRCVVYFKRPSRTSLCPSDTSGSASIYNANERTLRWYCRL